MTNAPNNHPTATLFGLYTLFIVIWIFLILTFSSCTTQDKFNRVADKHKDWLASKCSQEFPIDTTSVHVNTDTIKAYNKDYTQTIDSLKKVADSALNYVKHDTVYSEKDCNTLLQKMHIANKNLSKALEALRANYKPCEPFYIRRTVTITKEDTAKLYGARNELKKVEKELARKELWNKVLLGATLISVALIFILKR